MAGYTDCMDTKLSEHISRMLPWLDEDQKRKFLSSEAISICQLRSHTFLIVGTGANSSAIDIKGIEAVLRCVSSGHPDRLFPATHFRLRNRERQRKQN